MNDVLAAIRENWFLITFFAGIVYGWAELKSGYKYLSLEIRDIKTELHELKKILLNQNKNG